MHCLMLCLWWPSLNTDITGEIGQQAKLYISINMGRNIAITAIMKGIFNSPFAITVIFIILP